MIVENNHSEMPQLNALPQLEQQLIEQLQVDSIRYCHWKSNFYLHAAADRDLDLLVDRRDAQKFESIVARLGLRRVVEPARQYPSVFHFFGLDEETGEFIHLHVFYRVITGESLLKDFSLPLDQPLLEGGRCVSGLVLPSQPAELVVFVLRTLLKHGSFLEYVLLLRRARLGYEDYHEELHHLSEKGVMAEAYDLLECWLPSIDRDFFDRCVRVLGEDGTLWHRWRLARQLRRRLAVYNRFHWATASVLRSWMFAIRLWRHAFKNRKMKQFASGGRLIAFVAPEASGKSTILSHCEHWLGSSFQVSSIHAGKPPASLMTVPIRLLLPFARWLLPGWRTTRIERQRTDEEQTDESGPESGAAGESEHRRSRSTSLLFALRALALAWDRLHLLQRSRRWTSNGMIVFCDRYPSRVPGAVDSPRLQNTPEGHGIKSRLYRRLARLELALYQKMPPPDVVIRLHVSLETATHRNRERTKKGKESDEFLAARHEQARAWKNEQAGQTIEIDVEGPLDETLLRAQRAI